MDMNPSKHREIVRDREAWCASPWGRKESDTTKQLNNNKVTFQGKIWGLWLEGKPGPMHEVPQAEMFI